MPEWTSRRVVIVAAIALSVLAVVWILRPPVVVEKVATAVSEAEILPKSSSPSSGDFPTNVFPTNVFPSPASQTSKEEDATSCLRPKSAPLTDEQQEQKMREFEALARQLASTNDAEHVIAAAFLSAGSPPSVVLERLQLAAKLAPNNPIVPWHQLRVCGENADLKCDFDAIRTHALTVDGDNGALLLEFALRKLVNGDVKGAEDLLRRVVVAPRFDNYFIDIAMLIERGLASRGDQSYVERVTSGMGFAATLGLPYGTITKHCSAVADPADEWVSLCFRLGEKMLAHGTSIIDQAIGTGLMKIAVKQSSNPEEARAAGQFEQDFKQYYQGLILDQSVWAVTENDEHVLRQYVENFATHGELLALERLSTEVARLKMLPDYDPCNFVSPSFPSDAIFKIE